MLNGRSDDHQIQYAQCWEDPRTLTQALAVNPEDTVVSIASGGDNTFALLLGNPRSITAVDRNPAQIFLTELKMCAIQTLEYDDFVAFVGARPCKARQELYAYVRPSLTSKARSYWDTQTSAIRRGVIHCGKFERYFRRFRQMVLPLIHSRKTARHLLAGSSLNGQRVFYDQVWNNRRWRWLFRAFFSRFLLGSTGRGPAAFTYVTRTDVGGELLLRAARGLTRVSLDDNFFVEYIVTGGYANLETAHPYLRASNFQFLKDHVSRVTLVVADVREYLQNLACDAVSKFNLSDIFEYMSEKDYQAIAKEILRASQDGARVAYWSLFVPRPVPPASASHIDPQVSEAEELLAGSRTFFYGSFHVWRVLEGAPC